MLGGAVKRLLQHQQSSKSIVDAKVHIHEITRAANSYTEILVENASTLDMPLF
jgi:hypothetical protein